MFGKLITWGTDRSHPAGVRGLKPHEASEDAPNPESHPAGVRGLKPATENRAVDGLRVAPRRGAWIETAAAGTAAVGP